MYILAKSGPGERIIFCGFGGAVQSYLPERVSGAENKKRRLTGGVQNKRCRLSLPTVLFFVMEIIFHGAQVFNIAVSAFVQVGVVPKVAVHPGGK